jgi:hypothetical protein
MNKFLAYAIVMGILVLAGCNTKLGRSTDALNIGDPGTVNIDLTDLKVCCVYLDENGNAKNCMVLEKYPCSYCSNKCGNQTNSTIK